MALTGIKKSICNSIKDASLYGKNKDASLRSFLETDPERRASRN
ncbi:hypothetical protein [Methanosarcina sp. 2.H.A.1B.4]|nr:hypothetical protein [Methanosarcina sp. 2.H.A.1B.4]